MVNTIIAFDDQDAILGDFFNDCKTDMDDFFESKNLIYKVLKSIHLNDLSISVSTQNLSPFIFGAYSHGEEDYLISLQGQYISTTLNHTCFKDSFFYTCSCSTGKTLGQKLIDEGCLSFIGYKTKFTVWDFNRDPFIDCANLGLKLFFLGLSTNDIIQKMKERYNHYIDNYRNDIFGAVMLMSNKKALTLLGENINISNLINV